MRQRNPRNKYKSTCSKCNNTLEINRLGKYRYCKVCHAENMRLNRPKHSQLSELQKKKANCRSYLNVYIKRGKIIKLPCEVCNNINSEAHHNDYDKPLEVKWLCRKHHIEYHKISA